MVSMLLGHLSCDNTWNNMHCTGEERTGVAEVKNKEGETGILLNGPEFGKKHWEAHNKKRVG